MSTFTKEELLRIAELSALRLSNDEVDAFVGQLKMVIEYTNQLTSCAIINEQGSHKNINVFRDDKAVIKDNALIIANAPQWEDPYFVVPAILE